MAALRGSWARRRARGRIRTGRGRGGRDPCRLCTAPGPELGESCPCTGRSAELRHTTGRRQAGRRAGGQAGRRAAPALAGRRGTCGVHMAARRGRNRARASTRQGGHHEPRQQGTPAGAAGYPACARRASRRAVRAPSASISPPAALGFRTERGGTSKPEGQATEWSWAGVARPSGARGGAPREVATLARVNMRGRPQEA